MAITEFEGRKAAWQSWHSALFILMAAAFLPLISVALFGVEGAQKYYAEHGPVETTHVALYATAFVLLLVKREQIGHGYVPALILAFMTMRELDAHKWFTKKSVLSSGYYLEHPDIPLTERFIAGIFVFILVFTFARFAWIKRKSFMQAVIAGHDASVTLFIAILTLFTSKFIFDGARRKVDGLLGVTISDTTKHWTVMIEETLEMCVGILICLAIAQRLSDQKRRNEPT